MNHVRLPSLFLTAALTAVCAHAQDQPRPPAAPAKVNPGDETVHGRIVRLEGDAQLVLRPTEGKELIFHATPKTRVQINNQVAQFRDLRPGMEVNVSYTMRDGRRMIAAVSMVGGGR